LVETKVYIKEEKKEKILKNWGKFLKRFFYNIN